MADLMERAKEAVGAMDLAQLRTAEALHNPLIATEEYGRINGAADAAYGQACDDAIEVVRAAVCVGWQYRFALRGSVPSYWSGWEWVTGDDVDARLARIVDSHQTNGIEIETRPIYTFPEPPK